MPDTPYRPSNGCEGQGFYAHWCENCARDKVMNGTLDQDEAGDADLCPLIANSLAFDVTHPEYPKEWVLRDGVPTCTAYTEHIHPGELSEAEKAAQGVLL